MAPKSKKIPTPTELLAEVERKAEASAYGFSDYVPVIHELQQKGYSYAKIAEFLADRLSMSITKGQVYRAYQIWRAEQEGEEDGPPEIPDTYQELIDREAEGVLEMIEHSLRSSGLPEDFAEAVLLEAARRIQHERDAQQAAEKAAEEADKAREGSGSQNAQ